MTQAPDVATATGLADDYLADIDPATWSWADYLLRYGEELLKHPEGRRLSTVYDPLLFAILYLRNHLASPETDNTISISDFHVAVCRHARSWCRPRFGPAESRTAWVAPRGSGKALALGTAVLTANRGWTTHGELMVGDTVFDENGKPCRVVRVSERWKDRPAYRLTFSDGQQIVADAAHEWFVNDRYRAQPGIQTTEEMAAKWLLTEARGHKEVRYSVPACAPLQYPDADLPIQPYVLGAWLGDGDSSGGRITVGARDAEDMVKALFNEGENPNLTRPPSSTAWAIQLSKPRPDLCPREHPLDLDERGKRKACRRCVADFQRLKHGGPELADRTNQPLIARLRDAGLLGHKRIPEPYFTASAGQRLALLQGLMDTDGTIGTSRQCEFTGVNEQLCRDVLRLARTLGIKAQIATGRATIDGVDKGPKWRVTFVTDLPVFRLPRKAARIAPIRAAGTRRITSIERVENQTTSCIEVDSPSHLYLVGESLIPTHNSTWFFLILPLWALAHKHRRFIAAFANSATQAEQHLLSLKRELDTNELLREDYPDLCNPAMRPSGTRVADRQDLLVTSSSLVFMAKGIDSSTLGAKIGSQRPDMLLFDDVEPDDSNYSIDQKDKRLATIRNAVMPMNLNAVLELVGTTTMQGSIVHDVVRQVGDEPAEETPEWPRHENIKVQYFPAIVRNPDGTERSLWPQRWTLAFLDSIRDTPSYALNFDNKPVSQGGWWQPGDVRYGRRDHYDRTVLFVDGAVTAKPTSDFTGLTVMGLSLAEKRLFIRESIGIKLTGEPRRQRILQLAVDLNVDYIMAEANQGGDMWLTELHDMPCKVATFKQTEPKPVRIRRFLAIFQRAGERIFLEKRLPQLETQLAGYPNLVHDDVIDSAAAAGEHLVAILFASTTARRDQAAVHQFSYR